jgi:LemA protein
MSKGGKTALIVVGVIAVFVLMLAKCGVGTYNKMVSMDESVTSQWAEVQNQYQRRYDLIPNLVATVKGYAAHESEVYEKVAEARSQAGGVVKVDESILNDPQAFARYQQIQDQLGASLQRLLMVSENYPELKADQNFLALQDQLEGTENRITVARKNFNDQAQQYNSYIRTFPNNIIAAMSNFEKKQYFTAGSEAQTAPKVDFN